MLSPPATPRLVYSRSHKRMQKSAPTSPSSSVPASRGPSIQFCASPASSYAIGEGLFGHGLHRSTTFRIYAVAADGQSCFNGGEPFTVTVRGPSAVTPNLIDNSDGTYDASWMASVTGTYLVSVLLAGHHVKGSPYAARVIHPGHEPSECRLVAPAGSISGRILYPSGTDGSEVHAVAGTLGCFDIAFHDALGRSVTMDPLCLRLSITPWRSLQDALATSKAYAIRLPSIGQEDEFRANLDAHVLDTPERVDDLALVPQATPKDYPVHRRLVGVALEKAGEYDLHVVLQPKETHITKGSPIRLVIHPAEPHAGTSCYLATASAQEMLAGQQRGFTIKTSDQFGNACVKGGATVILDGAPIRSGAISHQVLDQQTGEYHVSWSSRLAGVYDVRLLINGVPMTIGNQSHLRLTVNPSELCVQTSSLSGLAHTTAGEAAVVRIHCKDACGNAVDPCPDIRFSIRLWDQTREELLVASCEDSGGQDTQSGNRPRNLTLRGTWLADGIYELAYMCTSAGTYDFRVIYTDPTGAASECGIASDKRSRSLRISANIADSRGSALRFDDALIDVVSQGLIAGGAFRATVQVADRFGNPTTAQDGDLLVYLLGPTGQGQVTPRLDGSPASGLYTVREELRQAGQYSLSATLRGEQVLESPLESFVVRPEQAEGQYCFLVAPAGARAHAPTIFVLHCRDRFGNSPSLSDLDGAIEAGAITARVDSGPARPSYTIIARDDFPATPIVEITLFAQVSGNYRLHVWVNDTALPASCNPSLFQVDPQPFVRTSEGQALTPSPREDTRYAQTPRSSRKGGMPTFPTNLTPRGTHPFKQASPTASSHSASFIADARTSSLRGADGRGYVPTSPRNSTSPSRWHGLTRAEKKVSSRDASPGSPGTRVRRSRLEALASPRTPPLSGGRMRHSRARELVVRGSVWAEKGRSLDAVLLQAID